MQESMRSAVQGHIQDYVLPGENPAWTKPIWIYPKDWQADAALQKKHMRILEIGPGHGEFLQQLATLYPDADILAIEMKKRRFLKLVELVRGRELKNTTLFCGDARQVLRACAPAQSLDAIHIQFPDPWPKRRHTKHRLMGTNSLEAFAQALKPGGKIYFATDVEWVAKDVAKLFTKNPLFKSSHTETIQTSPTPSFASYFAEKWHKLGRTFYYQDYVRF